MSNQFFTKFISRYSLRYPRSIVYMLQASEYKIPAYFAWYRRVQDFRRVEVRKHFVPTAKGILLLILAWLIFVFLFVSALFLLFDVMSSTKYIWFLAIVILSPIILGYGITIPLLLLKILVQNPIQYFIIKNAKKKLLKHKAIKIGIAGSFGKTTMREILKTVLEAGKKVSAPPHSYNTLLGISSFIKNLKGDEEILIFEFGEYYKGDIKEMCEFVRPDMGVITGVNEAHLEKFKSLDTTANTIFELADWLGDKPLYVNGENNLSREHAKEKDIIYTINGISNWKIENTKTDLAGTSFALNDGINKFEFKSQLLGLHQIGPLCASIHIAFSLGMKMEDVQRGVTNTKPFDHRLELKTLPDGVIMLDDSYNGNPDGARAVIDFLSSLTGRRRFYVTPGLVEMGPKTEVVHNDLGKYLAKSGIEKIILIKNSVTPYIEQGLKEGGYKGEVIWFEDTPKMLSALPHLTVEGDVVLLQNDWPDQYY